MEAGDLGAVKNDEDTVYSDDALGFILDSILDNATDNTINAFGLIKNKYEEGDQDFQDLGWQVWQNYFLFNKKMLLENEVLTQTREEI